MSGGENSKGRGHARGMLDVFQNIKKVGGLRPGEGGEVEVGLERWRGPGCDGLEGHGTGLGFIRSEV